MTKKTVKFIVMDVAWHHKNITTTTASGLLHTCEMFLLTTTGGVFSASQVIFTVKVDFCSYGPI